MTLKKNTGRVKSGIAGDKATGDLNSTMASTAGLEVTATRDGFRRAGLVWGRKPARVKLSDLSDEQLALLYNCPGLTVTEVDLAAGMTDKAGAAEEGEEA
jgi:hypothetical protein